MRVTAYNSGAQKVDVAWGEGVSGLKSVSASSKSTLSIYFEQF